MRPLLLLCAISALAMSDAATDWDISGTVTYDGKPAKNVRVFPTGPERVKIGITDAQGQFVLHGNTPGRYNIHAQKEDLPEIADRTVSVAAGSHVGRIDFDFLKGAVIAGRVLDDQKRPVEGMLVEARVKMLGRNGVVLRTTQQSMTNDRGEYRLSHLADGAYVVTVRPKRSQIRKLSKGAEKDEAAVYPVVTF